MSAASISGVSTLLLTLTLTLTLAPSGLERGVHLGYLELPPRAERVEAVRLLDVVRAQPLEQRAALGAVHAHLVRVRVRIRVRIRVRARVRVRAARSTLTLGRAFHLAHELAEDGVVGALLRVPVVLVRAQLLLVGRWVRVRVRVRAWVRARVRVRLRLRARARVKARG